MNKIEYKFKIEYRIYKSNIEFEFHEQCKSATLKRSQVSNRSNQVQDAEGRCGNLETNMKRVMFFNKKV